MDSNDTGIVHRTPEEEEALICSSFSSTSQLVTKMLTVSLVLFAFVALATADDAATCLPGWSEHGGRCFFFDATQKSWAEAQAHCQSIGANLASVHSDDEHTFVKNLANNAPTWLGGSDCQTAGAWFWMDGTQMITRFWCPLKPDNDPTQCCLEINTTDEHCWDDVPCSNTLPYVCVKKP
ncbi:type-2 ice-structuring protein-like isoform X1 [Festucalex cinctus]